MTVTYLCQGGGTALYKVSTYMPSQKGYAALAVLVRETETGHTLRELRESI